VNSTILIAAIFHVSLMPTIRSLGHPDLVDVEKATASHKDGILTTSFPKVEAKKARELKIGIGT
jgi:hypothetical protein